MVFSTFANRDAAHTVHPLAGQGLNQGLADVECLARIIEQSLQSGSDIGKPADSPFF